MESWVLGIGVRDCTFLKGRKIESTQHSQWYLRSTGMSEVPRDKTMSRGHAWRLSAGLRFWPSAQILTSSSAWASVLSLRLQSVTACWPFPPACPAMIQTLKLIPKQRTLRTPHFRKQCYDLPSCWSGCSHPFPDYPGADTSPWQLFLVNNSLVSLFHSHSFSHQCSLCPLILPLKRVWQDLLLGSSL